MRARQAEQLDGRLVKSVDACRRGLRTSSMIAWSATATKVLLLILLTLGIGNAAANPAHNCANGAAVDSPNRCKFILRYVPNDTKPDARVAKNLQLKQEELARSIAVVVGISEYDNSTYNVPPAKVDVERLKSFLIDNQKFDEVIVLENKDATVENLRYFLREYALQRADYYQGRVRFLFAYSGHAVKITFYGEDSQPNSKKPSVGLALSAAVDDTDYNNLYGLNELSGLFSDLVKNTYQLLALINACFGGDALGNSLSGRSSNDPTGRAGYGITAGPDDKEVYSTADNQGSLFFSTIIKGVTTGDADVPAQKATLGIKGSDVVDDFKGLVRLGNLDDYLLLQIRKQIAADPAKAATFVGNDHHWIGPIEPFGVRPEGGFFFLFQNEPQISESAPLPNKNGTVRGIDVSHLNGKIDWSMVAKDDVQFAYVKATQSSEWIDPSFAANWEGSRAANVAHGAYHVFSFCGNAEAQVAAFLRAVKPEVSSLPPVLDIELSEGQQSSNIGSLQKEAQCAARLGREGIQSQINAMLDPIQRAYRKTPIIYGTDFVLDKLLTSEIAQKFGLWRVEDRARISGTSLTLDIVAIHGKRKDSRNRCACGHECVG